VFIQVLSDLHLEFHRDGGREFLESLDPSGVDALVVAGDVNTSTREIATTITSLCALYPRVLYVEGNHEFYGSNVAAIHHLLEGLDRDIVNFTWLHNTVIEIDGVRIGGTALWYPVPSNPLVRLDRFQVNDFNLIKGWEPWVYAEHERARAFIERELQQVDVFVTHYPPVPDCTSARFKGSPINHYFITNLQDLTRNTTAKLWIFGHTHDRMWHALNNTLYVCNPLGYPHEQGELIRGRYIDKCLVEVTPEGIWFRSEKPGRGWPGPVDAGGGPVYAGRG
jgi:predicted phosphodiesterase